MKEKEDPRLEPDLEPDLEPEIEPDLEPDADYDEPDTSKYDVLTDLDSIGEI